MTDDGKRHDLRPEDFKEILNVFGEKIPTLLNSLTDAIYGKDASAKFGTAVANFYRTLKDSGMTDEQAFKLSEQYMSSLNLAGIFSKAMGNRGAAGNDGPRPRRPPARHLGGRPDPGDADRRRLRAPPDVTEAKRATLPPRPHLGAQGAGAGA